MEGQKWIRENSADFSGQKLSCSGAPIRVCGMLLPLISARDVVSVAMCVLQISCGPLSPFF
jgi:hypothetical protein